MVNLIFKYRRIIKYLIAGGTAAAIDLGLLYFLTDILGIWYLISAGLAFVIAFFVSFFLQKFWTFRDGDREAIYKQMAVYLAVALGNLVINIVLMYTLVDGLKVWYMLAQFVVSGLIACESYWIYKLLIFNGAGKTKAGGINSRASTGQGVGVKILIATGIYPPDYRGPATMLEALPAFLAEQGYRVKVITYSNTPASLEERGKVYRILKRGPAAFCHLKYFLAMFKLALWADVIYSTDIYSVGYFSYLIKKLTGKKYIIRFAGDSAWETAVRLGVTTDYLIDFQKKTYSRQIERLKARRSRIMIKADKVIAVSKFLAGVAAQMGVADGRIKLIYNSIDFLDDNFNEAKIAKLRGVYGQGVKLIVSAGQLNPWKGFDGIVRSLPEIIKNTSNNAHLMILGDGQERENLKKLAHELGVEAKVHLLGKIEHGEIMNYFKAADLFILNSHYEGLSHTLLEVMKAGSPIIASNIDANREVIENNKSGILVNYNNSQEISQAAVKILQAENLASSLVGAAKEKLKMFNWENNIKLTVETINELL